MKLGLSSEEMLKVTKQLEKWGWAEEEPEYVSLGICGNLERVIRVSSRVVTTFCSKWGSFSGNKTFPIPSTHPLLTAQQHYLFERISYWEGTRGVLRRELCRFLAEELRKYLDEENNNK